jgi:hypothetical protein
MRDLTCEEITDKIVSLPADIAALDLLTTLRTIKDGVRKKSELVWDMETLAFSFRDPLETRLRRDIAEQKGLLFVEPFHDGVAWAKYDDDSWGIVDRDGNLNLASLCNPRFLHTPFRDGVAWVCKERTAIDTAQNLPMTVFLINKSGKILSKYYPHTFDSDQFLESGLVRVSDSVETNGPSLSRIYFMDSSGKILNNAEKYTPLTSFGSGRAWANMEGCLALIDDQGEIVKNFPDFSKNEYFVQHFSDGLSWIHSNAADESLLIDISGKIVCKKQKLKEAIAFPYSEGRSFLQRRRDGRCWLLDRHGNQISGPFDDLNDFSDGMAVARRRRDGRNIEFLIDKYGRKVSADYEWIIRFCSGVNFIRSGGKYHILNKFDEIVASNVSNTRPIISGDGLAMVEKDGRRFYINHWGEEIFGETSS